MRPRSHSEFRHRSQIPLPVVEDVEQQLLEALNPSLLAPRQLERRATPSSRSGSSACASAS
jgi:hypothetical protein